MSLGRWSEKGQYFESLSEFPDLDRQIPFI